MPFFNQVENRVGRGSDADSSFGPLGRSIEIENLCVDPNRTKTEQPTEGSSDQQTERFFPPFIDSWYYPLDRYWVIQVSFWTWHRVKVGMVSSAFQRVHKFPLLPFVTIKKSFYAASSTVDRSSLNRSPPRLSFSRFLVYLPSVKVGLHSKLYTQDRWPVTV